MSSRKLKVEETRPPKQARDTKSVSVECNLDLQEETSEDDKAMLKRMNLNHEQLMLKEENPALFWKTAANEILRKDLEGCLVDNQEVGVHFTQQAPAKTCVNEFSQRKLRKFLPSPAKIYPALRKLRKEPYRVRMLFVA